MTTAPIDPADPRLSEIERHILQGIAARLGDTPAKPQRSPEARTVPEGWRGCGPGRRANPGASAAG